ncbi:carbon storage regulator [Algisphaera agarilytica]|uniref:Translational regulator CsrA n=1 Tax=Algisphaera agarilytica TaxID=1385975 RepID=A0A7X0H6J8_9BACT|nr:carbon storage regulator [Algisphaera agarilytica]MBB6430241.1 carbon storage regulator [Algisphaera agarilytica]
MLALTRRIGEEVVLGDPNAPLGRIRVVDIHGDKVRLAFDFPREVEINRKELADEKRRESQAPPPPPEEGVEDENTDGDVQSGDKD